MLLFIHNLPSNTNINRVKQLIKDKCNISEVIVDNLEREGQTKKVTIGLADSSDAVVLMNKLNGLFINGHQLRVEDVRQKKQSEYPYCPPNLPQIKNPIIQPQHLMPLGRPMQGPPVQTLSTPVQAPTAYNNMPFYMSPVQSNIDQRNYVGNNSAASLVNAPGQVPFYQQHAKFESNKSSNQNQWKAQAITYPITGFPQKLQEPTREQLNVGHGSRREQESDWPNRSESFPQNSSMVNVWNKLHDLDVALDKKLSQNERSERQRSRDRSRRDCSPRDHSRRDRSPRDRPPRHQSRDHMSRRHSSRDRALRGRSSRERSRDRDYRRDNDLLSRNRYHPEDRPVPSVRRDRNRRLTKPLEERPQRPERLQRPDIPQRPERTGRPRRPDRQEHCEENDNHNHDYDNRFLTFDVDPRINQIPDIREQGAPAKRPHSEQYQPATPFVPPNASILTRTPVFQLSTISNRYDPEPYGPPSKIRKMDRNEPPRFKNPFAKFNSQAQSGLMMEHKVQSNQYGKPREDQSLSEQLLRHRKCVASATLRLTSQILKNADIGYFAPDSYVKVNLKKCVESRIDVVLQDNIVCFYKEVINAYRSKFSTDDDLAVLKAVIEKSERDIMDSVTVESENNEDEKSYNAEIQPGPSNTVYYRPTKKIFQAKPKLKAGYQRLTAITSGTNNGNNEKEAPVVRNPRLDISKPTDPTMRLPRFPKGDKQIYKDQKNLEKLELQEEIYTLEPTLKKALDDELALLCDEYAAALEEPADDKEQDSIRIKIKNDTLHNFEKVVQLHATKRILDLPNNLIIRIFGHPKPPKRQVLDNFLKNYDVACVKKTEKKYQTFFLVTCASYKCYDDLMQLGKVQLDDITLLFKPMHLTGPKVSRQQANKLAKIKSNIPSENINEVEDEIDDQQIEENETSGDEDGDNNQNLDVNITEKNKPNGDEVGEDNQNLDENITVKNEPNGDKDGEDNQNIDANITGENEPNGDKHGKDNQNLDANITRENEPNGDKDGEDNQNSDENITKENESNCDDNQNLDENVTEKYVPNGDEDGDNNQNLDENVTTENEQNGEDNQKLDKNITDTENDVPNELISEDFTTNDDIKYNDFVNWNDKRLDDSDVILLEKKHDIVVIDDNDKTVTEIVNDNEKNANINESSNNDNKEEENEESGESEDISVQNINTLDEGMIEGVDVTEDDLEDF